MQTGPRKITGGFKMTVRFVKPDARHRDLDNLLKAVLDCLQHAGVIENDRHCLWIDAAWTIGEHPCLITLEEMNDKAVDTGAN